MKLLFDENLSPKLPSLLKNEFPGSRHVRDCGLKGKTDREVWEYARREGFMIASKDSDFLQRSIIQGAPPKVVVENRKLHQGRFAEIDFVQGEGDQGAGG